MSDFNYLKRLLKEYTTALELRTIGANCHNRQCANERLHRLRIEIQDCMLRIEKSCNRYDGDWCCAEEDG